MYVLVVQTGKFKGKKIKVAGAEVLIGRDEDAGIRIGSDDVSRQHCLLTPRDNGVTVRDLDSRNGTFIDGVPLGANEDALLTVGSSLTVGPMTFQLGTTQPRKSARPDRQDAQGLSDDDISTWLTEADTGEILSASDTTIVVGRDARKTPPPIQPPKKREFKSVAEEAEDIFRRYREMIAQAETGQKPTT
jgi:predicted component of type VI protein secretion system